MIGWGFRFLMCVQLLHFDPQPDPHGETFGKVSRAPGRKFRVPARCFLVLRVWLYIIWVMKFPMVSAA